MTCWESDLRLNLMNCSSSALHPFGPAEKIADKYLNPVPTVITRPGATGRALRRLLTEKRKGEPDHPLGPFRTDRSRYSYQPASGLRVTWLGHSTILLEIDGYRVLTDPVWSERASFVQFAGPRRFYAPPLALEYLPQLDAILFSHDHYDHLDRATVTRIAGLPSCAGVPIVCSVGVGRYLEAWGIARSRIRELNWSETAMPAANLEITATPSRHFSGRSLWNRNETLWSSFVIRGNRHNVFFGADSGMFPGFQQIGDAYGPFDLTMLEIGAYDADWPEIHMGPANAARAHLALHGKLLLPIHWGLFNLAFHPWREPVEWMIREAEQNKIQLLLPEPGVPTEVTGASLHSLWWRR